MVLTLVILLGVVYHLTISHHGPGLLRPLLARHEETTKSEILDEARQREDFRHPYSLPAYLLLSLRRPEMSIGQR